MLKIIKTTTLAKNPNKILLNHLSRLKKSNSLLKSLKKDAIMKSNLKLACMIDAKLQSNITKEDLILCKIAENEKRKMF